MAAQLEYVFGNHCKLHHGFTFKNNQTIIFLAGNMLVTMNVENRKQTFLPMPELIRPTALAEGPRNVIAIAEKYPYAHIILYDVENLITKLLIDHSLHCTEFRCLAFSPDFKFIASQSGPPEWTMVLWNVERRMVWAMHTPTSMRSTAEILEISYHPLKNDLLVVLGKQFLRIYALDKEEGFHISVLTKFELYGEYVHGCWLTADLLGVCTTSGTIICFEDQKDVLEIPVAKDAATKDKFIQQTTAVLEEEMNKPDGDVKSFTAPITFIAVTSKRVVCVIAPNTVVEYTKSDDHKSFKFKQTIHLPVVEIDQYMQSADIKTTIFKIMFMQFNHNEDLLAVCTDAGQLLVYSYVGEDIKEMTKQYFRALTQPVHRQAIVGVDVAVSMPFIVTCSSRTTVVWDYEKLLILNRMSFAQEILNIAIHPFGFYIAVAFRNSVVVFTILEDNLFKMSELNVKDCTRIKFAYGGHMMAVVNSQNLEIYEFLTMKKIREFQEPQGSITDIVWKYCDTMVFCCDNKGGIYCWKISTNELIFQKALKKTVLAMVITADGNDVYCTLSDSTIRQLNESKVFYMNVPVNTLSLPKGKNMLLGGTQKGNLRVFQLPKVSSFVDITAHFGRLNKIQMTSDDTRFVTIGEDGMLCIWKIQSTMERHKPKYRIHDVTLVDIDVWTKSLSILDRLAKEWHRVESATGKQLVRANEIYKSELQMADLNLRVKIKNLNQMINHLTKENNLTISQNYEAQTLLFQKGVRTCFEFEQKTNAKIYREFHRSDKTYADSKAGEEELVIKIRRLLEERKSTINRVVLLQERKILETEIVLLREKSASKLQERELLKRCRKAQSEAYARGINKKSNFGRDMDLRTAEVERLKEAHKIGKKKSDCLQAMVEEVKERMTSHANENTRLKNVITNMEVQIVNNQKTVEEKQNVIHDLQGKILEVQLQKESLEKNTSILESAKNLQWVYKHPEGITPSEMKNIEDLRSRLEYAQAKMKKLDEEMEKLHNKLKAYRKELADKKSKATHTEYLLDTYKKNLQTCVDVIKDPKRLKKCVIKYLHSHSVTKKTIRHADPSGGDQSHFSREHLEKTLHLLRTQLQKERKMNNIRTTRMGQEKDMNLRNINKLRENLAMAKQSIINIEKALGIPRNEIILDGMNARRRLEEVYTVIKAQKDEEEMQIKEQDEIIEAQKKEIAHFHALLYGARPK